METVSYDKSTTDISFIIALFCGKASKAQLVRFCARSVESVADADLRRSSARLLAEEGAHEAVCARSRDRKETALERAVVGLTAHITRLAELAAEEADPQVRAVYEYMLADVLTHRSQLAAKLARTQGISPLAQAGFNDRPGRAIVSQFIPLDDILKKPYAKERALPATKFGLRLVLAQTAAINDIFNQIFAESGDRHLIGMLADYSRVTLAHLAMVGSLIDPSETWMERWFFSEAAVAAGIKRAASLAPGGRLESVFRHMLQDDRRHLDEIFSLGRTFENWRPAMFAMEAPSIPVLPDLDDFISKIIRDQAKVVCSGTGFKKAA